MEPTPNPQWQPYAPPPPMPPAPMPSGAEFAHAPTWAQDSYVQIHELLAYLRRQTPVKHIAEALLSGRYRAGDPVHTLITALTHTGAHYMRERTVAIWALGRVQLTDQERDSAAGMLQEILEEEPGGTYWQRFGRGLLCGYAVAIPVSLLWSLIVAQNDREPWLAIFLQMIFVLGTIASAAAVPLNMVFGKIRTRQHDVVRQAAAETLGRLGVLESVGALAHTLFDPSELIREASAQSLHTLLPNLTESHYGVLGEQTIRNLGHALTYPDTNLAFKILDALAKIGTSHAIPYVDRIAKKAKTTRLQDKALEVLLRLDERKKRGDEANVYLRPSSSLTSPTGQLLRPTYHTGETEPLQLLRSSDTPSESP